MSTDVRFAFAGTPEFAAWVLKHLHDLGRAPVLVISQPDRPRGRGRKMAAAPAVEAAQALGIPWLTTVNINEQPVLDALRERHAQMLIVAAFGQMLRPVLLDSLPCLNVHASLLPAYRGAAPIVRALRAGETETGVCIMRMLPGLDDGPWAERSRLTISPRDDAGSLGRKLALLGAVGVDQVLTGTADGNLLWTEQVGEASYAPKVLPEDRPLDLTLPARLVHAQVRSLSPDIGCDAAVSGLQFKVWRAWPVGAAETQSLGEAAGIAAEDPGRLAVVGERLFAGCDDGLIEFLRVQPAGKGPMDAASFLRGYASRLGGRIVPADRDGR